METAVVETVERREIEIAPDVANAILLVRPSFAPEFIDWLVDRLLAALRARLGAPDDRQSGEIIDELAMLNILRGNIARNGGLLSGIENASLAEHVGIASFLINPWSSVEDGV